MITLLGGCGVVDHHDHFIGYGLGVDVDVDVGDEPTMITLLGIEGRG